MSFYNGSFESGPEANISTHFTLNTTLQALTTTATLTVTEREYVSHEPTRTIAKWINGLIILLGFVTNTLILIILSRRKIGSQTTRIILIFLATTDLIVMIVELFVHYIPFYWQWFPIFYSDIGCGFASFIQAMIITTSSWYIVLMTLERFTVVFFPMKGKLICTQRNVLLACLLIPVASAISFCYLVADFGARPNSKTGYMECLPKEHNKEDGTAMEFKSKIVIWIILYFFVPAVIIVLLNAGIVVKLAQAQKISDKMSRGSTAQTRNGTLKAKLSSSSSNGGTRLSRNPSVSRTSSQQSIRKATTLVIVASISFVVLMIPRGVSTTVLLDANWGYSNETEFILDAVAYLLQYLNHAINFFLYVLANKKFRKEIQVICCRRKQRPTYTRKTLRSDIDSEVTQLTYVRQQSRALLAAASYHDFSSADPQTSEFTENVMTDNNKPNGVVNNNTITSSSHRNDSQIEVAESTRPFLLL